MGKGKADVDYWAARVKPGTMLYELAGVHREMRVFDLRCAVVTEKIEDPSLFPKLRRDIARLKTERRSRELASQTEKANA
jgi:ribosomal protein L29